MTEVQLWASPWVLRCSRAVLEDVAVRAYTEGLITQHQVGRMLGIGSRFEVEEFLRAKDVPPDYTTSELESDLRTLRSDN